MEKLVCARGHTDVVHLPITGKEKVDANIENGAKTDTTNYDL